MDLRECYNIIKKRMSLIIAITLACILVSAVFSYFIIKPVYKSDISVIIGRSENSNTDPKLNYNDVMMYQKMVKTYSELAKSRTVAEDVIKKLNLNMMPNELLSSISISPKGDTEFLTITVKSRDPKQARDIANQMAKSLKDISKQVKNVDNVQLLDEAMLPTKQDSPKPLLNMAIALFLGIMISIGVAFLIEYLDNTLKTQEDIEKILGIPVIGVIPLVEDND